MANSELLAREEPYVPSSNGSSAREIVIAGMRAVETRTLTDYETRWLAVVGYGGLVAGVTSGVLLPELLHRGPSSFLWTLLFIVAAVTLALAVYFVGPALRGLRAGYVYVLRGQAPSLSGFDLNQINLFGTRPFPEEMVVLADRKMVLRMDGVYALKRIVVRPARVARDRGPETRTLTEAERAEIRDLLRFLRPPSLLLIFKSIYLPFGVASLWRRFAPLEGVPTMVCVGLAMALLSLVVAAHWSSVQFARRLRHDLENGHLTEGKLASGIPWLHEGEAAPWRAARPSRLYGFLSVDAWLKL